MGKKDRPSPSESATLFPAGTKKKGNDGNMYIIKLDKNGKPSWKKDNSTDSKSTSSLAKPKNAVANSSSKNTKTPAAKAAPKAPASKASTNTVKKSDSKKSANSTAASGKKSANSTVANSNKATKTVEDEEMPDANITSSAPKKSTKSKTDDDLEAKARSVHPFVSAKMVNGESVRIVKENGVNLDIQLNTADVDEGSNSNKYYIIQGLESVDSKTGNKTGSYYLFTKWGRNGEENSKDFKCEKQSDISALQKAFAKKFKDKASNNWNGRNAEYKKGKYAVQKVDLNPITGEVILTLGLLLQAEEVLNKIKKKLKNNSSEKDSFASLTSEFYTLMPTSLLRDTHPELEKQSRGTKPPTIDTLISSIIVSMYN